MTTQPLRFPIGISDFRIVREAGYHYVDKTALIDDVINENASVLLVPRPRRFGKTLNLSMLRHFFDKRADDLRPLFEGLAVASSEDAWAHFQRYPVIFLTFKDIKPTSWQECIEGMANVVAKTYEEPKPDSANANPFYRSAYRTFDTIAAADRSRTVVRDTHRPRSRIDASSGRSSAKNAATSVASE